VRNPVSLAHTFADLMNSHDASRFTYRARHTGAFVGMPASGAEIVMRPIDVWRVEDGMFVEHWDELNMPEAFQQMGAVRLLGGAAR